MIVLNTEDAEFVLKALIYLRSDLRDDLAVFNGLPELLADNWIVKREKKASDIILDIKYQLKVNKEKR